MAQSEPSFVTHRLPQPTIDPYKQLRTPLPENRTPVQEFMHNAAYVKYLKMHKVFVGEGGAKELESIHTSLQNEQMPQYLIAGGWAAVEAALVQANKPLEDRISLFDSGLECWQKALESQRTFNEDDSTPEYLRNTAVPFRIATDLAVSPLLKGVIVGQISDELFSDVFKDCLAIAQANYVQHELAKAEGDTLSASDHIGFAYECNALLALNRAKSKSWFAIPTMARSDSGCYHPEQTHDLLVIRRKAGQLQSTVPVEIKATANLKIRNRYLALLVRGKMHLTVDGDHTPWSTLNAITAVHEGYANNSEQLLASTITTRIMQMLNDYYEGEVLGSKVAGGELTVFHDKSLVAERHAGLGTIAIGAA